MTFSKAFPKTVEGVNYPKWEEVFLTEEEEKNVEVQAKKENVALFKECIDDARNIAKDKNLKDFQTDIISIAIALFEKRSGHVVYWKEQKAKDKFNS
tara:strand:+ start:659 stop:949 length:291 start_codon:yes stop_codon:yes gene_type:complete